MSSEQDTIMSRAVEHLTCLTEGFIRIATSADVESLFLFINKTFFNDYYKYKGKGFENRLDSVEYDVSQRWMFNSCMRLYSSFG
jgi:hypothetical protein